MEGIRTPLAELRHAHQYTDLAEATDHVTRLGETIREHGLPETLRPLSVAFTGSGQVSQGAQEIFDRLPFQELEPGELANLGGDADRPRKLLHKVVLGRSDLYCRADGGFDAGEYADHPERYRSALPALLPHLTALVNGIYWEPRFPRLLEISALRALWLAESRPTLRVIGDITCDVGGSIEATRRATHPGDPVFVYDVETGDTPSGVAGRGPVVMAVDNLPCELPRESSGHFGDSLQRFVPPLARCNWDAPFDALALPEELRRAVVCHLGALTPRYRHLEAALRGS